MEQSENRKGRSYNKSLPSLVEYTKEILRSMKIIPSEDRSRSEYFWESQTLDGCERKLKIIYLLEKGYRDVDKNFYHDLIFVEEKLDKNLEKLRILSSLPKNLIGGILLLILPFV